jgi:hypothetical protein
VEQGDGRYDRFRHAFCGSPPQPRLIKRDAEQIEAAAGDGQTDRRRVGISPQTAKHTNVLNNI